MPVTSSKPAIYIFTALPCEARPLIECFKLKKQPATSAFSIFINENIVLTVTGIGKSAMAAGVAYTQAIFPAINDPVMLNIGIAGHQTLPIGSLCLADKITDHDSGKSFYPPLIFTPPCPTQALMTFAKAQESYPESALCDMEASAFYETSTRFSTGELIHCLKIVSDNTLSPATNVRPQLVTSMIADKLDAINDILTALTTMDGSLMMPDVMELDQLLEQYHFTTSEDIQLKKLLTRWCLITGRNDFDFSSQPAKSGKEFIQLLQQSINAIPFCL